jgi:ElaB/YqjD/DUF883 family membrane-anchored ribosome-binding protein
VLRPRQEAHAAILKRRRNHAIGSRSSAGPGGAAAEALETPPVQSAAALVGGIVGDLKSLIEQQLQLTRMQIESELRQRFVAAAVFTAGVVTLSVGTIFVCFSVSHLLHWIASPVGADPAAYPLWMCHGVVAVILGVMGGGTHIGRSMEVPNCRAVSKPRQRTLSEVPEMIDTPELIQEQMKETKSQLSNKLESLEQQLHVADAVQTTRTAVAATAEAVQATAATVSGAMQSVSEAFDVRRQIAQHPWVALGGAAALGYVAHQLMSDSQQKAAPPLDEAATLAEFAAVTGQASEQQGHPINLAATAAATRAYNETLMLSSPLLQLKGLATEHSGRYCP